MSISFQKLPFANRHHGMSAADHRHMLDTIHATDLEQLIAETIPDGIRLKSDLNIPSEPLSKKEKHFGCSPTMHPEVKNNN